MSAKTVLSHAPSGARTLDTRIKSPLLYQLSYVPKVDHSVLVGRAGLEPTTNGLKVRCSTTWANDPLRRDEATEAESVQLRERILPKK